MNTYPSERIELRAGDSLPGFAAVLEDQLGNPVDLTDAVCYLQVVDRIANVLHENECTIANPATGTVVYDWTGVETRAWGVGVHEIRVRVLWDNGDALIAPASVGVELIIRPEIAAL